MTTTGTTLTNHHRARTPIDCPSLNSVHTEILSSESNLTLRTISSVIFHLRKLSIHSLLSSLDPNAKGVGVLASVEVVAIFLLICRVNVGTNADNAILTKRSNILSETNNSHRTTRCFGPNIILPTSPKTLILPSWTREPVSP
jgi:hypothetical protein